MNSGRPLVVIVSTTSTTSSTGLRTSNRPIAPNRSHARFTRRYDHERLPAGGTSASPAASRRAASEIAGRGAVNGR